MNTDITITLSNICRGLHVQYTGRVLLFYKSA